MGKVLILTDGKAGHENQSKAFARALGCEFDLAEVHFKSKFHKALSYLLDRVGWRPLRLLSTAVDCSRLQSKPVAVIGTGSGTFYAAKAMAKKLGVKCGVVLYPRGYDIASFDCVLAPAFDRPKSAANVIEIPANLVANDEAFYAKGVEAFLKCSNVRKNECSNAIAVIVGGPNKCSTMTPEWMKTQLDAIFNSNIRTFEHSNIQTFEHSNIQTFEHSNIRTFKHSNIQTFKHSNIQTFEHSNIQYWVTTSRRTPPAVESVVDSYPWDYKLLYSKDHFNPIPAFVKLAKKLYVTAESTGMLSESCTFGTAEVIALDNLNPGPHKFRRFVEDLRKGGYVDGNRKVDLSDQFARARKLMDIETER